MAAVSPPHFPVVTEAVRQQGVGRSLTVEDVAQHLDGTANLGGVGWFQRISS